VSDFFKRLDRLGIRREQDLLLHLPLRYEDETRVVPIGTLRAGQRAQVEGEVVRSEVSGHGRRVLQVDLRDDTGAVGLRFLHFYGSQLRQFEPGKRVRASGEVRGGLFGLEIVHPHYRLVRDGEPLPTRLTPVYPTAAGIAQALLRAAVARALRSVDLKETVPPDCVARLALPPLMRSLRHLHAPPPDVSMVALEERSDPAWRRVIFDELLAQQLSLRRARAARADREAVPLARRDLVDRIRADLPFTLTGAQDRAWREVSADLAASQPMNRLVQGDVGSGKTAVALYAMLLAVANEHQAALMAPTEVLARQHFQKLQESLHGSRVHIDLLVGSLTASQRQEVLQRLALGTTDLVVGTQALASEQVAFAKLGLVVIDEQHKFGVEQRASLRGGEQAPHYLVLSATPIPRTLTMTAFGDLDVSILRDKPPGRMPVHSYLAKPEQESSWWNFVAKQVDQGRQAYVIAARVSQSDEEGLQGAQQVYQQLQAGPLQHLALGLLHGRMEGAEKQATLDQFASGSIDVLVATTVVEVGIDVPNATVMTILDADRLGLSQLHQLRGRVSRGSFPGYVCLMVRQSLAQQENQRLEAFIASDDGFQLAEVDWKLRGPGDLLGTRQHGLPQFRIADLIRDQAVVETTQAAARAILQADPLLDGPPWARLKKQVLARHGQSLDFGDVG